MRCNRQFGDSSPPYHRRSLRLQGHDYSKPGAYSVTICANMHTCLFGEVVDLDLNLNYAGRMVESWWRRLPDKFPSVMIDQYMVMPNHLHAIVCIVEVALGAPHYSSSYSRSEGGHIGPPLRGHVTLGRIIGWFKTMTTNHYIDGVKHGAWPWLNKRLWQRGFYDHVIRDESELWIIRRYIADNPARWKQSAGSL